jgi:hypothetical protein
MKIQTILDQIDLGAMALPEFQRGYVWNRDQVRGLMDSLYHRHPVGSLLVWVTRADTADTRGDAALPPGTVKLLLDGQQRITSLYGLIRGRPPQFFDGNAATFTGLHFHLEDETFEFFAPLKMKGNPLWIDVTELMQTGVGDFINRFLGTPELQPRLTTFINRMTTVIAIRDIDLHIEEVTGEDKTIDVVVDIFNRVNSGGTKLSKGDLALAKVCASWPDARQEMKARLGKWHAAGYDFRLEWLLRCVNSVATGEAMFSALKGVDTPAFKRGLQDTERAVDTLLNLISARLGLDHDRVLGSPYSFPLLARYLTQRGGQFADAREQDRLLYWYVHTFLWGRYAGATETVLNQDLAAIEATDGALDRLLALLRQDRGDLRLSPDDFVGWSRNARFYPLLYMLTRVCHARDWGTGWELSSHLLGHLSRLELHHIFPKALLRQHGYPVADVNALANFTFLTQGTNLAVSDRDPAEYLPAMAGKHPGAVESHWVPMDPRLWRVEHYPEFLAERRQLLARAANDFLAVLLADKTAQPVQLQVAQPIFTRAEGDGLRGGAASEQEERLLQECNDWVVGQGLPAGTYMHEVADPSTGRPLAIVDLAWPNGLQEGLSDPVALLIDEDPDLLEAVNRVGYRYFTDPDEFRAYVLREVLATA